MPFVGEHRLQENVHRFFETPHDRPPECALLITVYLDESRHDEPDQYMALAGFYGNEDQWKAFVPDWVAALGKRKSLHMNTLRMNSDTGAKRAKKLLDRLGPIPYTHGLTPVHAAIRTGDYQDIVAGSPHADKMPGYCICLATVMSAISWAVDPFASIKIVCEICALYEPRAITTFRQTRILFSNPARPYFSGIEFVPKGSTRLIEPADCLAFTVAHWLEDSNSQKSQICSPILGPNRFVKGITISREEIRRYMLKTRNQMGARWWTR